jgi:hypothetical protein
MWLSQYWPRSGLASSAILKWGSPQWIVLPELSARPDCGSHQGGRLCLNDGAIEAFCVLQLASFATPQTPEYAATYVTVIR